MPGDHQIPHDTQRVFTDDDWDQIKPINQGDYDTVPKVIPPVSAVARRSSTSS